VGAAVGREGLAVCGVGLRSLSVGVVCSFCGVSDAGALVLVRPSSPSILPLEGAGCCAADGDEVEVVPVEELCSTGAAVGREGLAACVVCSRSLSVGLVCSFCVVSEIGASVLVGSSSPSILTLVAVSSSAVGTANAGAGTIALHHSDVLKSGNTLE